jgi:hypothetical protein
MNKIFMMGALMVLALGTPTQATIKKSDIMTQKGCEDMLNYLGASLSACPRFVGGLYSEVLRLTTQPDQNQSVQGYMAKTSSKP